MKKIFLCVMCAAALTACNNGANKKDQAFAEERDSLMQVINDKDTELNEIMGTVNEIQEGFRRINEAEGRITVNDGNMELKEKLRTSTIGGDKLKKMVDDLSAQLEAQKQRVQELEAQLAEKDIVIAQQGEAITSLNENVNTLAEENKTKTQTVTEQDKQLHTAWYVFGTKSELKEQKILKGGDVLKSNDFNKDYFTKVDIRYDKEIKLYSKSAKLLTNHPAGSYKLEKDNKGQYVLHITAPETFWSVSKYLVIQVK